MTIGSGGYILFGMMRNVRMMKGKAKRLGQKSLEEQTEARVKGAWKSRMSHAKSRAKVTLPTVTLQQQQKDKAR